MTAGEMSSASLTSSALSHSHQTMDEGGGSMGGGEGAGPAAAAADALSKTQWVLPPPTADVGGNDSADLLSDLATTATADVSVRARDGDFDDVETINFVAYRIVANVIVGVGIVGNLINLIVLTRPKLKGVMYRYLLGLAASNLMVLVMAIPALMHISGAIHSPSRSFAVAFFQAHLEIPLLNSFMASSVYIIICMTVNRYISIYKPTHFQRIHTFKNAYIAIFFSFVGGALLHVPLSFETDVVERCAAVSNDDGGSSHHCVYDTEKNPSVEGHSLYRVYLWVSEALLRLGPIITLTILNVLIIVRFRKIAMKREVLKGGASGGQQTHRGSNASNNLPLPPASPYSGIGPPQSSSSGATASSSSSHGLRVGSARSFSVTANGRLSVPNGAVPIVMEDRTTSAAYPCLQSDLMTADPTSTTAVTAASVSVHPPAVSSAAADPTTSSPSRAASPFPQSPSKFLIHHHRGTPSRASSHRRRGLHNPEERMLVVVLIAIVILFVVCTTPAAFLSILVTEDLKRRTWFAVFRACANNLELLCFALNFFVYCLCSADIRRAFVDVLFNNVVVSYIRRKSVSSKPTAGAATIEMRPVNNQPSAVIAPAAAVGADVAACDGQEGDRV